MLTKFPRRQPGVSLKGGKDTGFSAMQKIAAVIFLFGTLTLSLQVFQYSTQRQTTLRSIADSDDAISNAFFTQRETLVLAIFFERWMHGNETKRAVLVRRALLGQRLNVKDNDGVANGERASLAYLESLEKVDECLAGSRDGVLASFDQILVRRACGSAVEAMIFEARQLGVDISGAGDVRVRDLIRSDFDERRLQVIRLWLNVTLLVVVGGFFGISRTKLLQKLRKMLENDQEELKTAQGALSSVKAELDSRILSENLRRSEDQRLDAEVRTLTTEIRKAISAASVAENLASGVFSFLNLDMTFVHLFSNSEGPDIGYIIQNRGTSELHPREPGIDRAFSSEMSIIAKSVWQQAEFRLVPILELKEFMAVSLVSKLQQIGIDENASLVPIGEGNNVLGYVMIHRGDAYSWKVNEISALQNSVSQAANAIGALHSTALVLQIRENQQVVSELRQLDRLKDEFTANVNHELRTPLTSIIGYLEVIALDSEELPVTTKNYLSTIRRNADRLLELIEGLLVVSRSASETDAKREDEVDFADVVVESVQAVREKDPSNSVIITTEIAPVSFLIKGDRLRLEQIVLNLVGNAVKFSKRFSVVHVALQYAQNENGEFSSAELIVKDSGIGIPADEIPQLFTRFYRASNAEKALIPGTGLGLSIVHQFVEDHGGSISVDSVVGEGTIFTVRLPLAQQIST